MALDRSDHGSGADGGYDYQFVETPPGRVLCAICYYPSRIPSLTECCGYVLCKVCLDKTKDANNRCPVCNNRTFVTFLNKQMDREVRSLHVYCTNKEKGCKWQGEINDIKNHLESTNGCKFENVKCKCGKIKQRRYLASHVKKRCQRRKVQCKYCLCKIEQRFVKDHHQEKCTKFPQSCPNKCEVGTLFRKDMEAHRKECPLEVIPCEYQSVGCEVKIIRKKRRQHEMDSAQEHLQLTRCKLAKTEERVGDLELMLHELMNENNFDNFYGELKSMAQWSVHIGAMAALSQSDTQICPVIVKISAYLKGDDLISDSSSDSSSDSFPINRSKDKYSSSFYTHNNGYKMCLKVNLDGGHREDPHLSVYCNFLKGPNDDKLTWPPRDTFEIRLLNQICDCQHHSKLIAYEDYIDDDDDSNENTTYTLGYNKYISLSDLNGSSTTCQFVKCNFMYFQICML